MAKEVLALFGFNRGRISRHALARTDLKRAAFSAETMTNWVARALGSMMLRPGLGYIGSSLSDAQAKYVPFVFSTTDTAKLEFTNAVMRVWIDEAPLTRVAVTSAVTNGDFDANVNDWTDDDEAGGTSDWLAGGYMRLRGNGTAAAIRTQEVTVAGANVGKEHALRINIARGPVILRVGTTAGSDDYIRETSLDTGLHSLAFTPAGNFFIRFLTRRIPAALVDSCQIEGAGVVQLTSPFLTADLGNIRWDQSGDIVFIACAGYQQRKVERRATRSWSIVLYEPEDGPFRSINTGPITITAAALTGDTTLTASASLFRSTHVGALWELTSTGQRVEADVEDENQFTDPIRITGVGASRAFTLIRAGTWVATVTLQRSLGEAGNWEDVTTYASNDTITFNDALDNQVAFYRIGVKLSDFASGKVELTLAYALGSITGVARITGFSSATVVSAAVLKAFGGTTASDDWAEGAWSAFRGFPTAVSFYEGRLWWSGKNGVVGSVSDAFLSFNPDVEGDAGPINRTIGSGPVDTINWLLPMQRLILGAQGAEHACRSSTLEEPLTPTNFSIKELSTQGSSAVPALKVDSRGIFLQRAGTRVHEIAYNVEIQDYATTDMTALIPEIGEPSIVRMAVQRQPDTRIHCVRSDGSVALVVLEKSENVLAWMDITTDGAVEDVVVLPGTPEDKVYYHVRRTINGATKRYLEKWALESEARGGTSNKIADSFIAYAGGAATSIAGLDHLEGATVLVWGNGKDLGTKTVSGGQITGLSEAVTTACVGLPYTAPWKSSKLAYAAQLGSALTQTKKLDHLGLILADTHAQGLQFGPDFDTLDDLPLLEREVAVVQDAVHESYDEQSIEFPGEWHTDSRLCLRAAAPRPCTVLAAVVPVITSEKI